MVLHCCLPRSRSAIQPYLRACRFVHGGNRSSALAVSGPLALAVVAGLLRRGSWATVAAALALGPAPRSPPAARFVAAIWQSSQSRP